MIYMALDEFLKCNKNITKKNDNLHNYYLRIILQKNYNTNLLLKK